MPSPLQEGFLTTGSVWEERNCWFWTPPARDKPVLPYLCPWCKIAFSTKKVHTGRNHRRSSFCVGPKGISPLFGRLLGRAFQSQWFPVLLPTCQQTSSLTQRGPVPPHGSVTPRLLPPWERSAEPQHGVAKPPWGWRPPLFIDRWWG